MLKMTDEPNGEYSSYKVYPENKPFLNTYWERQSRVLSKAYPESNRDLILSSLKSLQEKIQRLEHKTATSKEPKSETDHNTILKNVLNIENKKNDLDNQSMLTEKRISQLEKQLAKMRKMVDEHERTNRNELNWSISSHRSSRKPCEHASSSSPSASRPREPMEHVWESVDKKSNLDTNDDNHLIQSKSYRRQKSPSANEKKFLKSKSFKRSRSTDTGPCCNRLPLHYRLNIGDIPFVVGKSATPSHHLGSNVQNIISLLKMHHPKLCNSLSVPKNHLQPMQSSIHTTNDQYQLNLTRNRTTSPTSSTKKKRSLSVPSSEKQSRTSSSERSFNEQSPPLSANQVHVGKEKSKTKFHAFYEYLNENELKELISNLQEEYTKFVLEHYELTKAIINSVDSKIRIELEAKSIELDRKMQHRSNQITTLKNHWNKIEKLQVPTEIIYTTRSRKKSAVKKHAHVQNSLKNSCANTRKSKTVSIQQTSPKLVHRSNSQLSSRRIKNTDFSQQTNSLRLYKDIKTLKTHLINDQVQF